MKSWGLSRSLNGYEIYIYEVPLWTRAVTKTYEFLDGLTRHRLCSGFSWMWRAPLGRAKYEDFEGEPFLTNSLAGWLYELSNKILNIEWNRQVIIAQIPIDNDLGDKIWGEDKYWIDK